MEILPIIPRNIVTYNSMFQLKKWSNWSGAWARKSFIKKVRVCHIQELETPFVGNLYREENVIIEKFKKSVDKFSDNSVYS